MRKILLTLCLISGITYTYAQTLSYGINAGLNYTNLPTTITYTSPLGTANIPVSNGYLVGFHAALLVDVQFGYFSIQPGVSFTTKGGKSSFSYNEDSFIISATNKITYDYIEVPLNFLYRVTAGNGNFFLGGGPYLGLGVSGKTMTYSNINGVVSNTNQSVKFGSGDGDVKNPSVGINGLAGYQLNNGFTVSGGYFRQFGEYDTDGTFKIKSQGFALSLAYFFQLKTRKDPWSTKSTMNF